jgi:diguanylate cyclase (GGDEF)-like protein
MASVNEDIDMRAAMVEALYGTPVTVIYGVVMIIGVVACAYILSDDVRLLPIVVALAVVLLFRTASNFHYGQHGRGEHDVRILRRYEFVAAVGAWSTAFLVGAFGGYTVLAHPFAPASILGVAQTMGYLAGIGGRNTSRPYITQVQMSLVSIPFMAGLIATGEFAYIFIGIAVGFTLLATISSVHSIYSVFVSQIQTMKKLKTLASTDSLTGLANRYFLLTRVEQLIQQGADFNLISIDLDNFKYVNDMFGHEVGDTLLIHVAKLISAHCDSTDAIARIGGDEFMILTSETDAATVRRKAEQILDAMAVPIIIRDIRLQVGTSIGIAPNGHIAQGAIFKHADLALYAAKDNGKNRIVTYSPDIGRKYDDRIQLEQDLRFAIERGDITLAYQPIIDPVTRKTILVEALMRWTHPTRGPISPSVFVPLAESTGLINVLGSWVIQTACAMACVWPDEIGVSVNLSAKQFRRDHDLVGAVAAHIKITGLPAERLTLEITESALIDDQEFVVDSLHKLRAMGVKIALDDFGTGYSSLSYLAELPIDIIKIDRAFATSIANSSKSLTLMRGITSIARDLDLVIIVEGIETTEQLDALSTFPIDGIQGYIFAKPMDAVSLIPHVAYGSTVERAMETAILRRREQVLVSERSRKSSRS